MWMPNGKRIVWSTERAGMCANLNWQASDGSGSAERLIDSPTPHFGAAVSPDCTRLVVREGAGTTRDLIVVTMGTLEPRSGATFSERPNSLKHPRKFRPTAVGSLTRRTNPARTRSTIALPGRQRWALARVDRRRRQTTLVAERP